MGDIITFEIKDLIFHDKTMTNIIVSKDIFDCFVKNSYAEIVFADDTHELVYTYVMVYETKEGICMRLMD